MSSWLGTKSAEMKRTRYLIKVDWYEVVGNQMMVEFVLVLAKHWDYWGNKETTANLLTRSNDFAPIARKT